MAQNTENRAIQAILKKVTRSNLCLICDIKFVNEIAVRRHYLNVHHVGTFACKVFGCKQVERTNGDLRKHYCLWHWELMSRKFLLPVSMWSVFFRCFAITVKCVVFCECRKIRWLPCIIRIKWIWIRQLMRMSEWWTTMTTLIHHRLAWNAHKFCTPFLA